MLLEPNAGLTDRYWRVVAGTAITACGVARSVQGQPWLGAALSLIGGMFLADGILGTCPMYEPFGIDTRETSRTDGDEVEDHGYDTLM